VLKVVRSCQRAGQIEAHTGTRLEVSELETIDQDRHQQPSDTNRVLDALPGDYANTSV
jgi:hypothetical protein